MIRFEQAARIFSQTQAGLGSLTAEIPKGEWLTLLGPSGSGKTTLLRIVAGLETLSHGNLVQPHASNEIGYVFQEHSLLPWKTTLENILMPLELRGVDSRTALEKATPWIEKLRLQRFLKTYPHELSGGLRMRASLARALITSPQLLLLDEPFASLDEPIRIELGLELRELWKSLRPTVIMVTHSITEGLWLADRAIVLNGQPGKVVFDRHFSWGDDRPLSLRGTPDFLKEVEKCFSLLRPTQ